MAQPTTTLTPDEIDDLIYFSRTNDLPSLQESITTLSQTHKCTPHQILVSAIDIDEEGQGSGSCLLHYPSANGNLEIVTYLLSLLPNEPTEASSSNSTAPEAKFVNHQNASGNTALHWAGMNAHLAIVQALVRAGADPGIINAAGRDAVVESEWSQKDGWAECAVWMLSECRGLEKGVSGAEANEEEGSSERLDGVDEAEDEVALNGESSGQPPA